MSDLENIISSVGCTFAKKSKIEILPKFSSIGENSLTRYTKQVIKNVISFSENMENEKLDILVMEIDKYEFGSNLENLSKTVFTILSELSISDPEKENCMLQKIDDKNWTFTFNGKIFYIVVLSPVYEKSSSRYAYGSKSTFIFFQPKSSFQRQHLPNETEIKQEIKQEIRKNFENLGQKYDLSITLGNYECFKIVKPLQYGEEPIRWWEYGKWSKTND